MDQGDFISGTVAASVTLDSEVEGAGGDPTPPEHTAPAVGATAGPSGPPSPRTRAANLPGVRGKGTSGAPAPRAMARRAMVDTGVIDALDRMSESQQTIEKLRIEAATVQAEENRRHELQMLERQLEMVRTFADAMMRLARQPPPHA